MQREDKPRSEYERMFVESFERLVRAGNAYDSGHLSEAPNIAKEIYNFVYTHRSIKSIISQLLPDVFPDFIDSAKSTLLIDLPDGAIRLSNDYHLINARIGFGSMEYRPILERGGSRQIAFRDWWEGPVLSRYCLASKDGRETISRGELIQYIRNEEGGAHASAHYKRGIPADKLNRLMQGEYVDGYVILNEGAPLTSEPHIPAYATVRQIGWELEQTLRMWRPDLTSRANFLPSPGPRMRPV